MHGITVGKKDIPHVEAHLLFFYLKLDICYAYVLINKVCTTRAVQKYFECLIENCENVLVQQDITSDFDRTDISTCSLVPLFYSKGNYCNLIKLIYKIYLFCISLQ